MKNNLREKSKTIHSNYQKPDYLFLLTVGVLLIFGLFLIYDASAVKAYYDFGDGFRFLKYQAVWVTLGLVLFIIFQKIDYHYFQKIAVPLMVVTIFLLLIVLIPGIGIKINGSRRWLGVGFFNPQPSELAKLSVLIYFATWLTARTKTKITKTVKTLLLPFLVTIGVVAALLMLEPDLGTTIILFGSSLLVYFVSDADIRYLLLSIPVIGTIGYGLIVSSPYRKMRLLAYLDPSNDPGGVSYHINQVLIALGSGGLFGLGLGNSRQKYQYIPEVYADSIFAVVGEEFGFIGCILLLLVFIFLLYRGWKIVEQSPDQFGKLLSAGLLFWIAIQVMVNLGAMTGILPLTGVPLPFLSYGGSALLSLMMAVGILTNISKQRRS